MSAWGSNILVKIITIIIIFLLFTNRNLRLNAKWGITYLTILIYLIKFSGPIKTIFTYFNTVQFASSNIIIVLLYV